MSRAPRIVTCALLVLAAFEPVAAQGVRVQVIDDRTREPIGGAIVSLLDAGGNSFAEGLTSRTGHRLLPAPSAGEYRILVRRVGYVPVTSPAITVPAGDPIPYVLGVRGERVVLPSVVARARRECRTETAEVARTTVLWQEIRTALTASELARAEGYSAIQRRVFERELDEDGELVKETYAPWTTTWRAPFVATDPALLSRSGYFTRDNGMPADLRARDLADHQLVWHGPDASVLLSPEFEREHCFQVVAGRGAMAGAIGLAFEPIEGRRVPDIEGTLWVDRETAELRFVEFEYVNTGLSRRIRSGGGRIEFRRLPTGEWIVEHWVLRYPRLRPGRYSGEFRSIGFVEYGGEAEPARAGAIAGLVYDSLAEAPLANARITVDDTLREVTTRADGRFEIDGLVPGLYTVRLLHPVFDSLRVGAIVANVHVPPDSVARHDFALPSHRTFRRACTAGTGTAADSGMVAVTVYEGGGAVVAGAAVSITWDMPPTASDTSSIPARGALVSATDARGEIVACGLPVGTALRIRAEQPGPMPMETMLTVGPRAIASVDLVLRRPAPPGQPDPPPARP